MKHIVAFLVIAIWATTFVSSKVLLNAGLMPADIFFFRFVMAYIIMLGISHNKLFANNIKDELTLLGLGLMGGSLYFLTENMALVHSTAANVSMIVAVTPLLTAILISIFYKSERLNSKQILGSIIAFFGVTLIVLNGQLNLHLNPLGDTLALCAAFTWAFYSLFMRRIMGRYPSAFITRKVFFYGVVTILPYFAFVSPLKISTEIIAKPEIFMNLLFLGIVASSGCFLLWNWVMKVIGAVKSSYYLYCQSPITMLAAFLVLHERITWMAIAGIAILIPGMLLAIKGKNLKN